MSSYPNQHLAAILPKQGGPLEITYRPTPAPGPNDLLINVKAIAINPVDWEQRHHGVTIAAYPAIIGSDIAGYVEAVGSNVPADAPQVGARVAAFAPSYLFGCAPDYGAFQERVIVPASFVTPIPDTLKFNEATLLPLGVLTAWAGFYQAGIAFGTKYTPADKKGVLIWGGSSSVGSNAIQIAKSFGFKVYVTASVKHHSYLSTLGADRLFDYKDPNVVDNIVRAVKEDGVVIQVGYDAVGQLKECQQILQKTKAEGPARLASAVPLTEDSPKAEGVVVKFVEAEGDATKIQELIHFVYRIWLKEKLEKGEYSPSPRMHIVEGGLKALNSALDEWKKGVSAVKIVVEVS
ncbi:Dehydrogenase azaJ [Psilocybe cubensis]|uniref:Dehydrogenase azaJ n=2 Tax=Psilocybe cubensis TaxID=181762 RepID=A0ACB8GKJ9_PSICU|nr:Dehydrogenase azaJ [Psilocybe cubensis]KAH9476024.1 Dehydrogenase azaJ [Psilocybe cubensis]